MNDDNTELGFWASLQNVGGGEGEGGGLQVTDKKANENETSEKFNCDGKFHEKSEDFLLLLNDTTTSLADGASGNQGLKLDVNLNLGLGGERSSSTSSMTAGRESSDRDSQNKRPKVHSLSLDWGTKFENEFRHLFPMYDEVDGENVPNSAVGRDNGTSNDDNNNMVDSEVRMNLTDELLHMVFTFLDHVDLCRAAGVFRQWRDASSHENFWRYLNFENRYISVQQCTAWKTR